MLRLLETHPRAGLAVCVEFFIWGLGWLVWRQTARGAVALLAWVVWLAVFIAAQPVITALLAFFPPAIPLALLSANAGMLLVFVSVGLNSARALLKAVEQEAPLGGPAPAAA